MPQSDEQLMLDSRYGSMQAFELLVRRWDRQMLMYLHRCVGNFAEAEDLRQELFFKIYQKRQSYRPDGNFKSWLYRIATNLVIDKHARKIRPATQPLEDFEADCGASTPDDGSDSRKLAALGEFENQIFAALQRIPGDERIALVLRHFEDLKFKDIAELTNEPESTIKSRVYRGLQSMRTELKRIGVSESDCIASI
ncbi:MAG: sigma-70 family RNA polymerase sigma factor [Candidatus Omnitrophica bacterium]|nr:sigma-70 family RNA polymerase sigma factor [Candidatus Omnitrophota bacterium]